jgi:hypothetical protein
MSERLRPNGDAVRLGDIVLRTPGLEGEASLRGGGAAGMRAAALTTVDLERAFQSEGLRTTETVELERTNEVAVSVPGMRSTTFDEPAIELEVPAPTEGWEQFVLFTDEAGVINWSFARDEQGEADRTRGAGKRRTYVLRRRVAPTPQQPGTRGLLGAIGKKVLKVLAFPVLEHVGGEAVKWSVEAWERRKRPSRLRSFTPGDYTEPEGGTGYDTWPWPAGERALLLLHGTLSRAHIAFSRMPREFVGELHALYKGRVAAFDHPTLSEDPADNVRALAGRLPANLGLDVVCHSRGGLVARMLCERPDRFGLDSLTVERVVFVAAPNNGTALTDPSHVDTYVDSYTNLLNFFPDNGVTETLEGIINVAKSIAIGGLRQLRGLQSMNPRGDFLASLNRGDRGSTRYFALGADFEPAEAGFRDFAKDVLADSIFREPNDLVVPTASVYGANPSDYFPVTDRQIYPATAGVHHSAFFGHADALGRIDAWLRS